MSKRHTTPRGFTVVELIVVIIAISILATIVVVNYNGAQDKAKADRIIAQANAYISGLKVWVLKEGRPTTNTCIAPVSSLTGGVCPTANGWMSSAPYDATFNAKLASYSGIAAPRLGEYGTDSPKGLMWFHSNYYSDNRAVLYYTLGPNSDCGIPNVLSPNPGYDNLTLMNAKYTARDTTRTQCMIEVYTF